VHNSRVRALCDVETALGVSAYILYSRSINSEMYSCCEGSAVSASFAADGKTSYVM